MVLFPLDHYASDRVSNTKLIRTSTVVAVGENGEFETLNTQYKPLVRQPDNEQCD
jgi:diphthamide synthase (EF-2-diphthine--ammonia ligase)